MVLCSMRYYRSDWSSKKAATVCICVNGSNRSNGSSIILDKIVFERIEHAESALTIAVQRSASGSALIVLFLSLNHQICRCFLDLFSLSKQILPIRDGASKYWSISIIKTVTSWYQFSIFFARKLFGFKLQNSTQLSIKTLKNVISIWFLW